MSQLDRQLDRLLRAAAGTRPAVEETLAPFDETRLLAGWRSAIAPADNFLEILPALRRGLAFAGGLALLLILFSLELNGVAPADEFDAANAAINLALAR